MGLGRSTTSATALGLQIEQMLRYQEHTYRVAEPTKVRIPAVLYNEWEALEVETHSEGMSDGCTEIQFKEDGVWKTL